ncbi:hypothetical protein GOV14_02040 [Candidatus Pacearchaeota archaeon]|nr:hypothetical protein [Candidatus Pacearchaeota archaeon]
MAAFLFISTIGLIIISFIDYHQGLKVFQFGNPIIDEDWIFTILALIGFIISLRYVLSIFKKLDLQKKSLKERIAEKIKTEHIFLGIICLYILMLIIAFFDFERGKPVLEGFIFDPVLYKDEDIFIALLSLFGIIKFSIDYFKLKKEISNEKQK